MRVTKKDLTYLERAALLAKKGLYTTHPNPRVGCVLVKDDKIVGEGWHIKAGGRHAEVHALRAAGEKARGATCYVSLAPCSHQGKTPPCTSALIKAGVKQVIIGALDPNPLVGQDSVNELEKAGIKVIADALPGPTRELNPGFFKRHTQGLPWVRLKIALSLDGRVALKSGESQWITGPPAREDVHHYRARSNLILTGSNTVLIDDPLLNVRLNQQSVEYHQPAVAVLDTHGKLTGHENIFKTERRVLMISTGANAAPEGADLLTQTGDAIDLLLVLKALHEQAYNEVWVEAGPLVCSSFLQANLVDELIIYQAPKFLGKNAKAAMLLEDKPSLPEQNEWSIVAHSLIGEDLKLVFRKDPS